MEARNFTLAALGGALLGYGFAVATRLAPHGPDAGDWLTASAAFFGTMISIAAAYHLDRRGRTSRQRNDLAALRASLAELRDHADTLRDKAAALGKGQIDRATAAAALHAYVAAANTARFEIRNAEIPDAALWKKLRFLDERLGDQEDMFPTMESAITQTDPPNVDMVNAAIGIQPYYRGVIEEALAATAARG